MMQLRMVVVVSIAIFCSSIASALVRGGKTASNELEGISEQRNIETNQPTHNLTNKRKKRKKKNEYRTTV